MRVDFKMSTLTIFLFLLYFEIGISCLPSIYPSISTSCFLAYIQPEIPLLLVGFYFYFLDYNYLYLPSRLSIPFESKLVTLRSYEKTYYV